jgi:hypothetical protein
VGWFVPERNPADSVYGLVAIGALLAAESGLHETYRDTVISAVIAAILYWLLHAYSTVLGLRLTSQWRMGRRAIGRALAFHQPVLRGAAIPVAVLIVAWISGASQSNAVLLALWGVVVSLIALEIAAGIRVRAAPAELALEAGFGLAMGLGLLVLKIILH